MDANQDEPTSIAQNFRQHHVVQVHNPLSDDFRWTVARSVVLADPANVDPHVKALNLRNDAHPTIKHVVQPITLLSGETKKLPGDVAKVIVKHLVDEIMNREGHKTNVGDKHLRQEVEERVVINFRDLRSQLSTQSVEEQLEQQIRDLNKEDDPNNEQQTVSEAAFPQAAVASQETASADNGAGGQEGTPVAGDSSRSPKTADSPARA